MNTRDLLGLWSDFQSSLFRRLNEIKSRDVHDAWHRKGFRTTLYSRLLHQVGNDLKLDFEREFSAVDFVLKDPETQVPIVAVESENDSWDTAREIAKLCAFAAPLRVLMTVAEWDAELGQWSHEGQRSLYLEPWREEVRRRLARWPHPGVIALLVGEWGRDGTHRFYAHLLSANGEADDTAPVFIRQVEIREPPPSP